MGNALWWVRECLELCWNTGPWAISSYGAELTQTMLP